jgi:hypothetical protein
MRFEWFSSKKDAIKVNRNLQLPEFRVTGYQSIKCDARRKTGNFTCLEAQFLIKRNIGYHIAQTYVPTATCVLFSWISVWLPEEFVEGRIFVALTVFLTLSAESNSAKENLPRVSYLKVTNCNSDKMIFLGDRCLVWLYSFFRVCDNASSVSRY